MYTRWILATLHLVALGFGLGGIWARGRALRGPLDVAGLKRVFTADTWWGLAAVLWLTTGFARLFGEYEKPTTYYMHSHAFMAKMTLLVAILLLELWPMVTLIRWRIAVAKGRPVETARARTFAAISDIQVVLVLGMVAAATAMARVLWY